jgi:anti-sigma factor RsiW
MNRELLERLLIDRVFGQLSPDVVALLSEHISKNPEIAKLADELDETITLAAIATKRPMPRPTLPAPIPGLFWRQRAGQMLRMAASFAVGAGVVLLGMRTSSSRREGAVLSGAARTAQVHVTHVARSAEVEHAIQALPFWSNQRFYLLAAGAKQPEKNSR